MESFSLDEVKEKEKGKFANERDL